VCLGGYRGCGRVVRCASRGDDCVICGDGSTGALSSNPERCGVCPGPATAFQSPGCGSGVEGMRPRLRRRGGFPGVPHRSRIGAVGDPGEAALTLHPVGKHRPRAGPDPAMPGIPCPGCRGPRSRSSRERGGRRPRPGRRSRPPLVRELSSSAP